MRSQPKLGALAVVPRDGRVLLVARAKSPNRGLWGFPGGHVELGETGLAAAARELAEETGVVAEPVRYLGNIDLIARTGDRIDHHYLLAAVLCDWRSGEPVAADDALDARWVAPAEMASLALTPNVDRVLGWLYG
ncbi:NUDIX hydrolase [uncultured Jannaschia sp.]|uniref:NUDIX hydrolase n=1 Tax=uncultured Jannaschia sp. TaxID=293347 RepID=UPI002614921D|nr:NUDIX hydrolase [uncultured Jannaschia sp.]